MGNASSADGSAGDDAMLDPFDGADTLGYRVLGVQPNSPASKAGLVSFLDFLVGANGEILLASGENVEHGEEYPDVDLPALLEENKGKEIEFLVWNMKSQQQRLVQLTPDDAWGGAGLLGVTIRLDNYAGAEERLIRVLEIDSKQSPAALAGLVPFHDYILGTTAETLQDVAQLGEILEENVDRVVELYVYNSQSDVVRSVALMPSLSWGGNGLLGAEVGTGYLHRFPAKAQDTIGASVERKVRYLGTAPTLKKRGSSGNSDAKLELEPQLEMEAPPSESEDSESENVSADKEQTPSRKSMSETERMFTTPSASDITDTPSSTAAEPASEIRTAPEQDAVTEHPPPDNTAAALFSGPPPSSS